MKTIPFLFTVVLFITLLLSCKKDKNEIDDIKPAINIAIPGAFPINCDTLYFGETVHLKALFTDNVELGSYSIDIHHNFDHHSHSTEITVCSLNPVKTAVNPFLFIHDYAIPTGLNQYNANTAISLPSGNANGEFDEGDYHLFVSLTDKSGWSIQKGLNIKILRDRRK